MVKTEMDSEIACTEAYGLQFTYPTGDSAVGACLREYGEFARPELDFLLDHAQQSNGALIDVGANIGALALPFAARRSDWKVLAIEAHGPLSDLLRSNAERNDLKNVTVLHAAADAHVGEAWYPDTSLRQRGNFGNLGFNYPGPKTQRVRAVTLDEIAPANTRLVKIDVQGWEAEVLKGAERLRKEVRPFWLVEVSSEWPYASSQVIATLSADNYNLFWFYSPFATPSSPKARPINPATGDASIVALPAGTKNTWGLTPVTHAQEQRPGKAAHYPYLSKYGY